VQREVGSVGVVVVAGAAAAVDVVAAGQLEQLQQEKRF